MALLSSGQAVELREVVLRDKPAEMIEASQKATVPVLVQNDGAVIDESLDIMLWALEQRDPEQWLSHSDADKAAMLALIEHMDGPFKHHLDRYKYAGRHGEESHDGESHRNAAMVILGELERRLSTQSSLFGDRLTLADIAIAPFIRQFANVEPEWFAAQAIPRLQKWLDSFVRSERFQAVMDKYEKWTPGSAPLVFGPTEQNA